MRLCVVVSLCVQVHRRCVEGGDVHWCVGMCVCASVWGYVRMGVCIGAFECVRLYDI